MLLPLTWRNPLDLPSHLSRGQRHLGLVPNPLRSFRRQRAREIVARAMRGKKARKRVNRIPLNGLLRRCDRVDLIHAFLLLIYNIRPPREQKQGSSSKDHTNIVLKGSKHRSVPNKLKSTSSERLYNSLLSSRLHMRSGQSRFKHQLRKLCVNSRPSL